MTISNKNSRGIYKQQLMRREKSPTREAKKRAEDWLWDDGILRVFVDASELMYQGIFGLGVIYVGQGTTVVKFKKHYNQSMRQMNVYAELVAVEYALMQLEKVLDNEFHLPSKIIVNSDWNGIELLNESAQIMKRHSEINAIAEGIIEKRYLFLNAHPAVELEISYMGEEVKKYNPFYKAAHNAARKAIGL